MAMWSPVETVPGFETPLAVTCTVSPAATAHPPTVRVTVAPLLLVTQFSNPQFVTVVTSSIEYELFELNTVPAGAASVIVE